MSGKSDSVQVETPGRVERIKALYPVRTLLWLIWSVWILFIYVWVS